MVVIKIELCISLIEELKIFKKYMYTIYDYKQIFINFQGLTSSDFKSQFFFLSSVLKGEFNIYRSLTHCFSHRILQFIKMYSVENFFLI